MEPPVQKHGRSQSVDHQIPIYIERDGIARCGKCGHLIQYNGEWIRNVTRLLIGIMVHTITLVQIIGKLQLSRTFHFLFTCPSGNWHFQCYVTIKTSIYIIQSFSSLPSDKSSRICGILVCISKDVHYSSFFLQHFLAISMWWRSSFDPGTFKKERYNCTEHTTLLSLLPLCLLNFDFIFHIFITVTLTGLLVQKMEIVIRRYYVPIYENGSNEGKRDFCYQK